MGNVFLIGFMGTGKSAVGLELARMTGARLYECDEEIERRAGLPIPEIFRTMGEPRFRDLEAAVIEGASAMSGLVVSCGGGAVLRESNVRAMRSGGGRVALLTASPETIYERTRHSTDRPLLQVQDPMGRIMEMLDAREQCYQAAAAPPSGIVVSTEGKGPVEIAREIVERLDER